MKKFTPKGEPKLIRLHTWFEESLVELLKQLARHEGRTISNQLRQLVIDRINQEARG